MTTGRSRSIRAATLGFIASLGVGLCNSAANAGLVILPSNPTRTFTDDFNRPNGPVGNGWSNMVGNVNGNLVLSGGAVIAPAADGSAGIYRTADLSGLTRATATFSDVSGYGGLPNRFSSSFVFGSNGTLGSGLEVSFTRSDTNYNNSAVNLTWNGNYIASLASTFQFNDSITSTVDLTADGSITGTVNGLNGAFAFQFASQGQPLAGSGFGLVQSFPDSRSGIFIAGGIDNLTLTTGLVKADATPATAAQLSQMAVAAYDGGNEPATGFKALPGGSVGNRAIPNSVFAQAYISEGTNGGKDQIVIAIRGTQDKFNDFRLDNGTFAGGGATPSFVNRAAAISGLIGQLYRDNPNADFTLTGHSLGGGLAQTIGEVLGIDAVGFDAPGGKGAFSSADRARIVEATGNTVSTKYSLTNSLSSFRVYGDVISLAGESFGNVNTIYPSNPEAEPWLRAAATLPASCVSYCHSRYLINGELANDNLGEPGISDSSIAQRVVYGYAEDAGAVLGIVKRAKDVLYPDGFFFFDPPSNGNFIRIDQLGSEPTLTGIYFPALGHFDIFYGSETDWQLWGNFDGFSDISLPQSMSYLISNATALTSDEGIFAVGLRGSAGKSFDGRMYTVTFASVPEPSIWFSLMIGFGLLGYSVRSCRSLVRRIS